jgi:hypothetical protein
MRFVIMALLTLGTAAHAQAIFLTYDQWEQLPTALRELYVAGVVDGLSTVTVREGAGTAKHYNDCIVKSKMNLGQIAEGTKKFMEMHSDLRSRPAPNRIVAYLITVCGVPAPDEG